MFEAIPEDGSNMGNLANELLEVVPWNGMTDHVNNSHNRMRQKLNELRQLGALNCINEIVTVERMPTATEISGWFSYQVEFHGCTPPQ